MRSRLASGLCRELHFRHGEGQPHIRGEREMIGRLLGGGVVNRQVRDQARGPTENSVEREKWAVAEKRRSVAQPRT